MNAELRQKPIANAMLDADEPVTDTMLLVETPEKISFQYQLVGPFRRVIAYGLDLLFSMVGYTIIVAVVAAVFGIIGAYTQGTFIGSVINALGQIGGAVILIGYFLVYWFYGALMESMVQRPNIGKDDYEASSPFSKRTCD